MAIVYKKSCSANVWEKSYPHAHELIDGAQKSRRIRYKAPEQSLLLWFIATGALDVSM